MVDEEILSRDTIEAVVACYVSWGDMRSRCKLGGSGSKNWGARGITVCEAWTESLPYIRWALTDGDYAKDLTCDRLDNDGNYDPDNCYYVTDAEQNQNRRSTKLNMEKAREIRALVPYLTQREIGEIYGVSDATIGDLVRNETWKELEPVPRLNWIVTDEEILNVVRLYRGWKGMKHRVTPGYVYHHRYHDIGVIVCDEWYDFPTYYSWAVANGSEHGLTIDRRDNDGNYTHGNCRFATPAEQCQNQSTTKLNPTLVWQIRDICDNTKLSNPVIAEIYGVDSSTIWRVRRRASWKNI